MAAAGAAKAIYWIAMAAAAGGAVVESRNRAAMAVERSRIIEAERRAAELKALDESNQRLIALNLANQDILANAGGVDAYASPSLTAMRKFNFQQFEQDEANARLNIATTRANASAQISILNRNAKTYKTVGILDAVSIIGKGVTRGSMLSSPDAVKAASSSPSILKDGGPT